MKCYKITCYGGWSPTGSPAQVMPFPEKTETDKNESFIVTDKVYFLKWLCAYNDSPWATGACSNAWDAWNALDRVVRTCLKPVSRESKRLPQSVFPIGMPRSQSYSAGSPDDRLIRYKRVRSCHNVLKHEHVQTAEARTLAIRPIILLSIVESHAK